MNVVVRGGFVPVQMSTSCQCCLHNGPVGGTSAE